MSTEPHHIHVEPDGELPHILEKMGSSPVLLEKNGKLYRLQEEHSEELWAGYDPEKAKSALEQVAGSWADLDTDKMIADIYRVREEGSRPITRP